MLPALEVRRRLTITMQKRRSEGRLAFAAVAAAAALLVLGAGVATAARASRASAEETVLVERDAVDVRDIAASYGEVVGRAKLNERLAVVGRKGKWLNVRLATGKTGWVAESSLAKKDSGALDKYADVAGRRDAKTASGTDNTTAAKGGEEFDKLAKARGWDKDRVYAIEKRVVDKKAVRRFAEEGKLGAAEGGR